MSSLKKQTYDMKTVVTFRRPAAEEYRMQKNADTSDSFTFLM